MYAVSTRMTFLLMTLLLLLVPGTVSGQDEAEQADTPAVAIAIEDVPQQAVHTVTLLESLAPGPEVDAQIAQLSAKANDLLISIDLRLKDIVQALESTPKVRNMGDWEGELRSALVTLEALDAELGGRLAEVREALETVDAQDRRWSATREAAIAGDASEAVIERIDATIASITTTRKQLTDVRDELLGVRDRLFDPRANIDRTLKRLETKIDGRLADIFNRDQAAVWKANLVESVRSEM
ncbi:MAG: hypothetical protein OET45_09015, partial [Chromatiales bacterium]|nr:hypothetical protein [Chromatiales bacterium]